MNNVEKIVLVRSRVFDKVYVYFFTGKHWKLIDIVMFTFRRQPCLNIFNKNKPVLNKRKKKI
jgi:hypothetical protein